MRGLFHVPLIFLIVLSVNIRTTVHCVAIRFNGFASVSWDLTTVSGSTSPRWSVYLDSALSRSSYSNPVLGAVVSLTSSTVPGDLTVTQTVDAGPCCGKASGDPCFTTYSSYPGSGCGMWSSSLALTSMTVTAAYPDDQIQTRITQSFTLPATLTNDQKLSVAYTTCCRIDSLAYSAGSNVRVESIIVPGSVGTFLLFYRYFLYFLRYYLLIEITHLALDSEE